jgi:hypothetical protein
MFCRVSADFSVRRFNQTGVENVLTVKAPPPEIVDKGRRELVVDQEPHEV